MVSELRFEGYGAWYGSVGQSLHKSVVETTKAGGLAPGTGNSHCRCCSHKMIACRTI